MSWRDAHEKAMYAAAEAHDALEVDPTQRVDIFRIIEALSLDLLFRPLRGVSGLYVPAPTGGGILITSLHRLARQRFTAAHELGHFWLKHEASIDIQTEVLARTDLARLEPQEMVAEAFAAWFLMPPELVDSVLDDLELTKPSSPDDVYAMSLRLGTSYQATAYHLPNLKLLPYNVARSWATRAPKNIKLALSLGTPMASYHPDVWPLSARDANADVEVRAGDRLVVTLPETPSSGVMWSTAAMPNTARVVADTMFDHLDEDQTQLPDRNGQPPGGSVPRTVIVDLDPAASGPVDLAMTKAPAWAPDEPTDRYQVHLHVQQPLLGRSVAA